MGDTFSLMQEWGDINPAIVYYFFDEVYNLLTTK